LEFIHSAMALTLGHGWIVEGWRPPETWRAPETQVELGAMKEKSVHPPLQHSIPAFTCWLDD
jgi:hypothetical protein